VPVPEFFLFKTEPIAFSYADLVKSGSSIWDGVSNAAALIHLRAVRPDDMVFVYHTGDEKSIVGVARATTEPFEDPKRPGRNARGEPEFAVVTLEAIGAFTHPVTLGRIKADPRFKTFLLVTQSRLSVMPVLAPVAAVLAAWGKGGV